MSAVIKTTTPFAIETVLIKALAALGAEPLKVDASMAVYNLAIFLQIEKIITEFSIFVLSKGIGFYAMIQMK